MRTKVCSKSDDPRGRGDAGEASPVFAGALTAPDQSALARVFISIFR